MFVCQRAATHSRAAAQARRHHDRGRDLGQVKGAGHRLQTGRRTRPEMKSKPTPTEGDFMTRQMALVGFLQAQNCTNLPSSWRHPESRGQFDVGGLLPRDRANSRGRKIPHGVLRRSPGDADRYGNDHAHTVEYGIRFVKIDPLIVLTTMGMATTKLGCGSAPRPPISSRSTSRAVLRPST